MGWGGMQYCSGACRLVQCIGFTGHQCKDPFCETDCSPAPDPARCLYTSPCMAGGLSAIRLGPPHLASSLFASPRSAVDQPSATLRSNAAATTAGM